MIQADSIRLKPILVNLSWFESIWVNLSRSEPIRVSRGSRVYTSLSESIQADSIRFWNFDEKWKTIK